MKKSHALKDTYQPLWTSAQFCYDEHIIFKSLSSLWSLKLFLLFAGQSEDKRFDHLYLTSWIQSFLLFFRAKIKFCAKESCWIQWSTDPKHYNCYKKEIVDDVHNFLQSIHYCLLRSKLCMGEAACCSKWCPPSSIMRLKFPPESSINLPFRNLVSP